MSDKTALNRVKGVLEEVPLRWHRRYAYWYREDTSDKAMIKDCREHYNAIYDDPIIKGARVLDLGSNIGYFSKLCLDYGASDVVAVEADSANCSVILANIPDSREEFELQEGAVVPDSYEGDAITFYTGNSAQSSCSGSTLGGRARQNSFTCPAIRISDLLRYSNPTIIKCDIEGGEFDLFRDLVLPDYVKMVALEIHESAAWMIPEAEKLREKFKDWEKVYEHVNVVFGGRYAVDTVYRRP